MRPWKRDSCSSDETRLHITAPKRKIPDSFHLLFLNNSDCFVDSTLNNMQMEKYCSRRRGKTCLIPLIQLGVMSFSVSFSLGLCFMPFSIKSDNWLVNYTVNATKALDEEMRWGVGFVSGEKKISCRSRTVIKANIMFYSNWKLLCRAMEWHKF